MTAERRPLTPQDRKERKKLQNRMNQRARRQRMKDNEDNKNDQKHPYRIERWRLQQWSGKSVRQLQRPIQDSGSEHTSPQGDDPPSLPSHAEGYDISTRSGHTLISRPGCLDAPPLSPDHALLNLVTYNVCRGLNSNKSLLSMAATFIGMNPNTSLHIRIPSTCDFTVVRPICQTMPASLLPTQLQMNLPHPTWMDVFPFHTIRDNLIRGQQYFDHIQFLGDLIGDVDIVHQVLQSKLAPLHGENISLAPKVSQENRTRDTAYELDGVILWGEPHLPENWELTPKFLRKWKWIMEGCSKIIEVSNKWRALRGERPLATAQINV